MTHHHLHRIAKNEKPRRGGKGLRKGTDAMTPNGLNFVKRPQGIVFLIIAVGTRPSSHDEKDILHQLHMFGGIAMSCVVASL